MKTLFTSLLLFVGMITSAQDNNLLVTPEWVKNKMADPNLVVLQVSLLKYEYDKEHIPNAHFLWPGWLAPDSPYGNYNAPDPKEATKLLQAYGITKSSTIVLSYMRNDVPATARMFLTLENLGLRGKVYLLNGGLEAWKKAGYEVSNQVVLAKKGDFKISPSNVLVDKNYVLEKLQSPDAIIIDARVKNFYDGAPSGNPRNGHIKGAKNIAYPDLLDGDNFNAFKSTDVLQGYFSAVVPDKSKELVSYCFTGQTASVVYMAGRILGYNIKLYDGSMQEWSRLEELPMEESQK